MQDILNNSFSNLEEEEDDFSEPDLSQKISI